MQALSIVGVKNVTIVTFTDEEDEKHILNGATREDGSLCHKTAKKIEIARAKRRLASQGAVETRLFPVEL